MGTTPNGLVYAELNEAPNGPGGFEGLGLSVDARYGLTVANVAALAGIAAPFAGMSVWVTTPGDIYTYSGSAWVGVGLGAWTAYTPTVTGWALGNGVVVGWRVLVGKTVHFRAKITAGTTTTFGSTLSLSLPATASANVTSVLGQALLFDSSASANLFGTARLVSGAAQVVYNNAAATNITGAGGTSPWTWATGDIVEIAGTYEAA